MTYYALSTPSITGSFNLFVSEDLFGARIFTHIEDAVSARDTYNKRYPRDGICSIVKVEVKVQDDCGLFPISSKKYL